MLFLKWWRSPAQKFPLNNSVWTRKNAFFKYRGALLKFLIPFCHLCHFLTDRFKTKPPSQSNVYKVTPGDPNLSESRLGEASKFVVPFCLFWPKGVFCLNVMVNHQFEVVKNAILLNDGGALLKILSKYLCFLSEKNPFSNPEFLWSFSEW